MTLQSIFVGEGFQQSPGQFLQIMKMWIYHSRSRELMALINQNERLSISEQAQRLVDWMDNNATIGQRDSCVQYVMDALD